MNRSFALVLVACVVSACGARTLESEPEEQFGASDAATSDTFAPTTDDGVIVPGPEVSPSVDSGTVVVDAAPPGLPITCGRITCDTSKQQCCLPVRGSSFDEPTCTPIGGCTDGVALSCSSAASCASGQTCCLSERSETATCKTACNTGGPGREITLCRSNAECPMGARCRSIGAGLSGCVRG